MNMQAGDFNGLVIAPAGSGGAVFAALKTYIKITFAGGGFCICEAKDLADMTEGAEGFRTEEVQMTEAEFEALPEFQS